MRMRSRRSSPGRRPRYFEDHEQRGGLAFDAASDAAFGSAEAEVVPGEVAQGLGVLLHQALQLPASRRGQGRDDDIKVGEKVRRDPGCRPRGLRRGRSSRPRILRCRTVESTARSVAAADAFVFVTPEYDHGPPPSLIDALVYLVCEWAHKPVSFVSYGGPAGATRAVQMVKPMMVALKMMVLLESVMVPRFAERIDAEGTFRASEHEEAHSSMMLDALETWTAALVSMRGQEVAMATGSRTP